MQKNIPLKNHTTFKIGGRAKYFWKVATKEELIGAVNFSQEKKLPFFILGGGSNLLVSDKGFPGLVIKIQNTKYKIQNTGISAGAGLSLAKLVSLTAKSGLSGLEWLSGIPGTVGGAIRGNAGAFGSSMADMVESVEAFDINDSKFKTYGSQECRFGYRQSIFKKNKNLIIFSATFKLKKKEKEKINKEIKKHLDYRQERHPKEPSAGSVFKNPPGLFARDLILECGLQGKKIGGVEVSEKHANFILNTGKGKAKDVLALIKLIKKEVKKKFGIKLEEEIEII